MRAAAHSADDVDDDDANEQHLHDGHHACFCLEVPVLLCHGSGQNAVSLRARLSEVCDVTLLQGREDSYACGMSMRTSSINC